MKFKQEAKLRKKQEKIKGWKLVPCAYLLTLPMKPEEATNSQDNVRKASAIYALVVVTYLNLA